MAVPAKYRATYDEMMREMGRLALYTSWDGVKYDGMRMGADLFLANGGRGEDLLNSNTKYGITKLLDKLQALGLTAIHVSVGHNLLLRSNPRCAEYEVFYRRLSEQIADRGLLLTTEGSAPFDTVVTYTLESFMVEQVELSQQIIDVLQPQYHAFAGEPTMAAKIFGVPELAERLVYEQTVRDLLATIDRGNTKIGAGIGTWDDYNIVMQFLATLPGIDFIDLHVYPFKGPARWQEWLLWLLPLGDTILHGGKEIIVNQAWPYKMGSWTLRNLDWAEALKRRDTYSFWSPVDQRFLEVLYAWAHSRRVSVCCLWGSSYFLAYQDWSSPLDAKMPAEVQAVYYQELVNALSTSEKIFSPTGAYLKQLLA